VSLGDPVGGQRDTDGDDDQRGDPLGDARLVPGPTATRP
jgi:hypothetical protein